MKPCQLDHLQGFGSHVFEGTRLKILIFPIDLNLIFLFRPTLPRLACPSPPSLTSPLLYSPLTTFSPLYLMDPPRKDLLPYAASCNPPRKVKRPNTTVTTFPP